MTERMIKATVTDHANYNGQGLNLHASLSGLAIINGRACWVEIPVAQVDSTIRLLAEVATWSDRPYRDPGDRPARHARVATYLRGLADRLEGES